MTHIDIINRYQRALPPGDSAYYRIDGIDHVGLPIMHVTFTTEAGDRYHSIGYGETEGEALVGAYGEIHEKLQLAYAFANADKVEATYNELVEQHGSDTVIDPVTLTLPAGSHYHADLPLCWTTITRYRDRAEVWCPVEFVASFNSELGDYPNQLTTAITNGNGAGDTLTRALLHGTLELLQRDGNADCFRALDQGRVLDVATFPEELQLLVAEFRKKDLEILPKLARTTCGCVSLYAVGRDLSDEAFPLSVTACGEAADPSYEKALRKAILECASSHTRKLFVHSPYERKAEVVPEGYITAEKETPDLDKEEPRALNAMVEWLGLDRDQLYDRLKDTVFSEREQVPVSGLPNYKADDLDARLDYVQQGLADEGMELYYSYAPSENGEILAVKSIVPGMEMEFGSYHRIGRRGVQRLQERGDALLSRENGDGMARIRLTEEQEAALGGPFYLNTAALDAKIDPVYPLYREPDRHAARYAYDMRNE